MRLNTDIPSVAAEVQRWIYNLPPGSIFFPQDITVRGSDEALRKALSQLVKETKILRVANGIYVYPKKDKLLGTLKPSLEDVAKAIARRDKVQLQPNGALALNKLGISTQVPMNHVYYIDGTPRRVAIGKNSILFKKRSPRKVAQENYMMALIIAALEELGPDGVTSDVKAKLRTAIQDIEAEDIKKDSLTAPAWIRDILKELTNTPK